MLMCSDLIPEKSEHNQLEFHVHREMRVIAEIVLVFELPQEMFLCLSKL